jgi:hypothetical protein
MLVNPLFAAEMPIQSERGDIVARVALCHKIRHNFSDDAAKLEAVPGESRRDSHARRLRVQIENEMFIGSVSEHTSLCRQRRTIRSGKEPFNPLPQKALVIALNLAAQFFGVSMFVPVMILAYLEGGHPVNRKSVVTERFVIGRLQIEDWKAIRLE